MRAPWATQASVVERINAEFQRAILGHQLTKVPAARSAPTRKLGCSTIALRQRGLRGRCRRCSRRSTPGLDADTPFGPVEVPLITARPVAVADDRVRGEIMRAARGTPCVTRYWWRGAQRHGVRWRASADEGRTGERGDTDGQIVALRPGRRHDRTASHRDRL